MALLVLSAVALLVLATIPLGASAATIQLRFEGAVSALHPVAAPLLVPGVALGDPISIVLTFDSDASVDFRGYHSPGVPFGFEATVGSLVLRSVDELFVGVLDDVPLPGGLVLDSYQAHAALGTPALADGDALVVGAQDFTAAALSSAGLPLDAQALAGFGVFGFALQVPDPPSFTPLTVIQGTVFPVPEPYGLALLCSALVGWRCATRSV